MLEMKNELLRKQPNTVPGRSYIKRIYGLSTGTVITKETKKPNYRVPWELYYLVESFLLEYVICASVPTEGTRILRRLIQIFLRGESPSCALIAINFVRT